MELSSIADVDMAELLRSSGDAARLLLTEWRDCVSGTPAGAAAAAAAAAAGAAAAGAAAAGAATGLAVVVDPGARHCVWKVQLKQSIITRTMILR